MEVQSLQRDMSQLFSETVQRLSSEMLGMQQHMLQTLKQLEEQSTAMAKQLVEQAKPRVQWEHTLEVPQASGPPAPGSFGAWLSEPSVAIRVSGEELHIHGSVLRTIPYFEGLLRSAWCDSVYPQVDLPCSSSEFCLLLQRLYTGEILGTPALPVKDGGTAVRLAVAAAMLLIDEAIPELPAVLRGSITTDEDCQMATAAGSALPGPLGEVLKSFGAPDIPEGPLQAMIESAKTQDAQAAARQVLATQHGEAKKAAVKAAARGLLGRAKAEADVNWAIDVAQEHLDCQQATEVFKAVPRTSQHSCSYCWQSSFELRGAHAAFLQHLQRCAEKGCAAEALVLGFEQPPLVSNHTYHNHQNLVLSCTVMEVSSLALGGSSCAALAATLRASRGELPALAECLSQMPAAQLAEVLAEDVLQALVQYVEGPIATLSKSAVDAQRWVTVERLQLLPRSGQQVLARALLPVLGGLSPEVATKVTRLLA